MIMTDVLSQRTRMVSAMGSWRMRVPVAAAMALVRAGAAVNAAVAEHGLAPGGGAERPDEAAFDLRADQVRADGDAAVEREGDLLDADPVAFVEGEPPGSGRGRRA